MTAAVPVVHATTIALWHGGAWRAVVVRGPSGAGKSDLALRAMAQGWRLVADDRTIVWSSGGRLFARAPDALAGLIEARGLGVERVSFLPLAEVCLIADLVADPASVERIPDPETERLAGIHVRRIALFGIAATAVQKISLAVRAATLGAEQEPAYQGRLADEDTGPTRSRGPPKRNR